MGEAVGVDGVLVEVSPADLDGVRSENLLGDSGGSFDVVEAHKLLVIDVCADLEPGESELS